MAKALLSLRLDRLKYQELSAFGEILIKELSDMEIADANISAALQRLQKHEELMKSLSNRKPKFQETADLELLRKELNRYISALLLHLKAIERANFDNHAAGIPVIAKTIRTIFKNAVHEGGMSKLSKTNAFLKWIEDDAEALDAFIKTGLWPYAEMLKNLTQKYKHLKEERRQKSAPYPKGEKIKIKAALIEQLRIFLQTVELSVTLLPTEENAYISGIINTHIKPFRTQLRNLATRRKRAKEKT